MLKRMSFTAVFIAILVFCGGVFTGCTPNLEEQKATRTELVMDTVATVTLYGEQAQQGVEVAFAKAKELEKILSAHDAESELYRLNQNAVQQAVAVSETLFTVTQQSLQYCRETDGALDCTIGKLNDLWGFGTSDAK